MKNGSVSREKVIARTSVIGIVTNLTLAAFKAVVGFLSSSIAIVLDALNNTTDALSSLITVIGAAIANKKPDKKHPLGHGRVEYISAVIVSAIVLYAGITAAVESVKKIFRPETANYTAVSFILLGVAVVVKIVLGLYVSSTGKKVNSSALVASGKDALFDAIISVSVLVSAVIYLITGFSLEAYVGILIAAFIIKSGFGMLRETLDDILGKRISPELSKEIKDIINSEEKVLGAFDLFVTNYGPDRDYATVHIELPDTMNVDEVDRITRKLQKEVYSKTGVVLVGVGVYSFNTSDGEAAAIRNAVQETVFAHDCVLQLHGFYADTKEKTIRFDVVLSFDVDAKKELETLYSEVGALYPDYTVTIVPDLDISD